MIRRGCYSSKQLPRHKYKKKYCSQNNTWVISQEVLFFIAIKMGSAVLMMHSQEIEVEAKESIKRQIQKTFKSNMLPMHKNLVNKQVHEEQSNKHRKIKQV